MAGQLSPLRKQIGVEHIVVECTQDISQLDVLNYLKRKPLVLLDEFVEVRDRWFDFADVLVKGLK